MKTEEDEGQVFQIATKASRMLNYLIDQVLFAILTLFCAGMFGGLAGIESINQSPSLVILIMLLAGVYYFTFEFFLGKTPAKFITRTHIVDEEGNKPTLRLYFIRSLCRLIPFDNISFLILPNGWHDSISGTHVVYDVK